MAGPEREGGVTSEAAESDRAISIVDLPDEQFPAPVEEHWLPLPGEAGSEIEALARAALGDLVPAAPEPSLDFNMLDDTGAEENAGCETPERSESPVSQETPTAAEVVAQVELPEPGHLEVTCPTCSTTGLVPWDRLGGALCCSGCWTWFRAGRDGQLAPVDPPAANQGALRLYSRKETDRSARLEPEVIEEKRRTAQRQRRRDRLAGRIGSIILMLVPVVTLALLMYGGVRWWSRPQRLKLPQELDQRARLLVEAWLKRDTTTMVALTHRDCRGITRHWVHGNPSPLPPGKFDRRRVAIDVRVQHQDQGLAEANVSVDLGSLTGSPDPIVMRHRWELHEGNWLYKPSLSDVSAKRTPGSTPTKRHGS